MKLIKKEVLPFFKSVRKKIIYNQLINFINNYKLDYQPLKIYYRSFDGLFYIITLRWLLNNILFVICRLYKNDYRHNQSSALSYIDMI